MIQTFDQEQLEKIENVLTDQLIECGVSTACVVDMAGCVITSCSKESHNQELYSLAAVGAGNFNAVAAMAEIIGDEEFTVLFHNGESKNLYFSKINNELLLITVFSTQLSLGFLRLRIAESISKVNDEWENPGGSVES